MHVSMAIHTNIEGFIKKLETKVSLLAKHISDLPSNTFNAKTKNNSKDQCCCILVDERIIVKAREEEAEGPKERKLQDEACKVN